MFLLDQPTSLSSRSARSWTAGVAALFLASSLLGLGCAAESGMAGTGDATGSTVPWSQALVTQAAQVLMQQYGDLYTSAREQPAFAGERSEYGQLLDKLRILKEESAGLHAKLEDGKGKAETMSSWERVSEVSRDAREDESWQFLPEDFSAKAKNVLAATDTLDGFYGTQ